MNQGGQYFKFELNCFFFYTFMFLVHRKDRNDNERPLEAEYIGNLK